MMLLMEGRTNKYRKGGMEKRRDLRDNSSHQFLC